MLPKLRFMFPVTLFDDNVVSKFVSALVLVLEEIPRTLLPVAIVLVPVFENDVKKLDGKIEDDIHVAANDGPVVRGCSNSAKMRLSCRSETEN